MLGYEATSINLISLTLLGTRDQAIETMSDIPLSRDAVVELIRVLAGLSDEIMAQRRYGLLPNRELIIRIM